LVTGTISFRSRRTAGTFRLSKAFAIVEDVSLVIPTIDDELPIFGKAGERLERVGIRVAISGEQTGLICNDEYETYQFCLKNNIPVPVTTLAADIDERKFKYP
jgi:glutathione synthase/RimK-type ligase-like ATP-grasp enzyme